MTGKKDELFAFQGMPQKLKLISNNICFGPAPDPGDEVEQHLTITAGKGIWLTRYRFGGIDDRPNLLKKEKIPASADVILRILDAVVRYFQKEDILVCTDVGTWNAYLTNTEGKTYEFAGSLIDEPDSDLSDYIRSLLGRNDLFLFDGNPDRVERIEVSYDRRTEAGAKRSEKDKQSYGIWDYHETLKIDRASETIEHYRKIADECDVRNTYHIADGVPSFLDEIGLDAFSEVEGNPTDVYEDLHEIKTYQILFTTKKDGTRKISGSFDKNGLPKDWPEFVDHLMEFLSFYGIGEIFDESVYGKERRRISDLVFCNVVFEDGGRKYCYLSDDEYEAGDLVIVPAGSDNHEAVVRIESVEYHPAEEAPFPLDKIKHVIRRFEEEKDADLL